MFLAVLLTFGIAICHPVCTEAAATNANHSAQPVCYHRVLNTLNRIILPELEFNHTSIKDAVDVLARAALANDPAHEGVDIQLTPSATMIYTNSSGQNVPRVVTLSTQHITLRHALKLVTEEAGLKCRVNDSAAIIMTMDERDSTLLVRTYSIPQAVFECLPQPNSGNNPDELAADVAKTIKSSFETMNVSWPHGSSLIYNPKTSKLVVVNLEENHRLVAALLQAMGRTPSQIQISAQWIAFDAAAIKPLVSTASSPAVLLGLCTNGFGHLLAAPTVIVKVGETSCMKSVTEVPHPTYADRSPKSDTNTKAKSITRTSQRYLEPAKLSVTLEVTPEILAASDSIILKLEGSIVEAPPEKTHPSVHINSFDSKLSARNNSSLLAFGGLPTRDATKLIYCVITVRLLDQEGRPLNPNESSYHPPSIIL